MKFSNRTAWDTAESVFTQQVGEARTSLAREGQELLDLTVSNPTACGFTYDEAALLRVLAEPAALLYEPKPFGMLSAREAIAAYYRDVGASVPTEHICLTTSTSEAYSFLFRLLCDPGDEVLVATPSYPLFDFIAGLDGVRLVEYPLLYHDGWFIDLHALGAAITNRARAIIVVHPNNPTGHFCSPAERNALQSLCAARGLALIVDEVFLDYPLTPLPTFSFQDAANPALTFVLSGISKVCALPQMKCSWIAASGPASPLQEALARLEVIADTFLSMNAPVQHALPTWLAARSAIQAQITARTQRNHAQLDALLGDTSCQSLTTDAGWACILRVPRTIDETTFAQAALHAGVLVQPGDFYGMPEGRIVLSLLTKPEAWDAGLSALAKLASS